MDDNPYQSPEHVAPEIETNPNPLVVVGLSIVAIIAATNLIVGGVVKTFIWGIGDRMYWQLAYGVVSLAAGVLILERLARYLRRFYWPKRPSGSGNKLILILIWSVIWVGVLMDLISIIRVFI